MLPILYSKGLLMTTIIDPAGTPAAILLDPSVTVDTVTAAGSTGAGATQLTRYSNVNVVAIEASVSLQGVRLPAADEGDYFELWSVTVDPMFTPNFYSLKVYDSTNADLGGNFNFRMLRYVYGEWRIIVQR